MSIASNLNKIQNFIPKGIKLIVISKNRSISQIKEAYDAGQRLFGESKVHEMVDKYNTLPKDISWHMIGHLQRNKVKYITPFVNLIQSIDCFETIEKIEREAKKQDRIINCLLQFKIAQEDTKFGLKKNEIVDMLDAYAFKSLKNIKVIGLMGMASFINDTGQIEREFQNLKSLYDELSAGRPQFKILSMGMSGDYKIAIQKGSNTIRIGEAIFGN